MHQPKTKVKPQELGRYACNEAFYAVRRLFPTHWNNGLIAGVEGFLAGYFLADVGTELYGEAKTPFLNFRESTPERQQELEGVVKGTLIALGAAATISPRKMKEFWNEHPVYSRGVLGGITGATIRGLQQLIF